MLTSRVVVGRQAIQNRVREVVGYELLFRAGSDSIDSTPERPISSDQMTAEVVFGALNIGLNHVVDGKWIFCNADRGVLLGELPITLPPEQTVIEILETVTPDEQILAGCRQLAEQGYTLALDDFSWFEGAQPLLELASIVKIDVQAVPADEMAGLVERCRRFGVRLLAEKVETGHELAGYLAMGFDLFQGYLLEQPVVVSGRTIEPGQAARLQMAAALMSNELDFDELEAVLRGDPGTAYQIMQLASLGRDGETRRTISTIRDALVLAGSRRVQNWMALLLARPAHAEAQGDFTKTLIRARACELLAHKVSARQASMGFAAGLLSSLDLLFGIPPAELRESLSIGDDLAAAAFGAETELASVIRAAEDYQLETPGRQPHRDLSETDLDDAFAQAFIWTMQTTTALES